MPYNGNGIFSRLFSWVADKDAGINIVASRMDSDTDDIATALTSVITRDGQSPPTANLPMGTFRHTGVGNGVAATDYAALGQVQAGTFRFAIAGGTVNALSAAFSPTFTLAGALDGLVIYVRAAGANTSTTPTIAVNGGSALTITKGGLQALSIGDIPGANYECEFMYVDGSPGKWELLNPWKPLASVVAGGTADALTATFAPAVTLFDGLELRVRAAAANATTTPTLSPNSLTARTITKLGGSALAANDIAAAGHELTLRYNLANTRWELLNPKGIQQGTLPVTSGGTGAATLAAHGVVVGNGTSAVSVTSPGTSGLVLTSNGASADPTFQAIAGTLTAGSLNTLNPYVVNTNQSVAHTLGGFPAFVVAELQCVTGELGYTAGDRVSLAAWALGDSTAPIANGFNVTHNATNTIINTHVTQTPFVVKRSDGTLAQITAGNWAIVVTPYKLN